MLTDDLVLELLELVRGRYYGKYKGSVTEVEGGGRGRIKAKVPAVLRDTPSGWCDPCVPYAGNGVGFAFLPEVGAGVWIEFEGGDPSRPIWSGCYWREGEFPEGAGPQQKLIRTASGHRILFDDENSVLELTDPNENAATLDGEGITLERGGGKVVVNDQETNINDGAMQVSAV
jgi:uncharacterized protein involved in type VI secretion and phage assembly